MELIELVIALVLGGGTFLLWKKSGGGSKLMAAGLGTLFLNFLMWRWAVEGGMMSGREASEISPLMMVAGYVLLAVGGLSLSRAHHALPLGGLGFSPSDLISLVTPRNESNSFSSAEQMRDRLYRQIMASCEHLHIPVVGYTSPEQSPEVWLHLDYVLPQKQAEVSLRASLTVRFERLDFHRWPIEMTVTMAQGLRQWTHSRVLDLNEQEIARMNRFLGDKSPKRPRPRLRARIFPLQLWRPKNKIKRLRTDWPVMLWGVGIFLCYGIFAALELPQVGILTAILLGVGLIVYQRLRRTYVLTTGRPLRDPRSLSRLDSWQATIERLGPCLNDIRNEVLAALQGAAPSEITVTPEWIWYPGVDGKVERMQIVARCRRGIGFVHLESYGDDLYVGWDTHVNSGTWLEQKLATGIDRESGRLVSANRVVPGWQTPTEYDLTDTTFLTEWLHSILTRIVRLKMAEFSIDQEIDFKVQRESRQSVLGAQRPASAETNQKKESPLQKLRRLA